MRALVTGAAGFIGGHLTGALLRDGHDVVTVDVKLLRDWIQVHPGAHNVSGLDLATWKNAERVTRGCDVIYHLAADAGGMGFISTHKAACTLNILADTQMIRAATAHGARIFYASSACVYPLSLQEYADAPDLAEWMAYDPKPEPEEAYGWEKLFAERMYLAHADDHGTQVRIARFQSVYGPQGVYRGGREKAPTAICRKVAEAKLAGRDWIEVWGDGTAIRTFTYVDDCVSGILAVTASEYGQPLNIGSDETMSIAQLVQTVGEIAEHPVRMVQVDGPVGVPGRRGCDTTLVGEKAGWKAQVSTREGLERTYAWVLDQVKAEQP